MRWERELSTWRAEVTIFYRMAGDDQGRWHLRVSLMKSGNVLHDSSGRSTQAEEMASVWPVQGKPGGCSGLEESKQSSKRQGMRLERKWRCGGRITGVVHPGATVRTSVFIPRKMGCRGGMLNDDWPHVAHAATDELRPDQRWPRTETRRPISKLLQLLQWEAVVAWMRARVAWK